MAHEKGNLNDLRAILGNDVAIKAYRKGKLPFPDGTIIARLAWSYVRLEENDRAFGRAQSFVAWPPTNGVQFMVKDSRQYASTGGWGSLNLTTADPPTRRCTTPAFPATRPPKLAPLSSPVTHLTVPTIMLDGDSDGVAPATNSLSSAKKFSGKCTHPILTDTGYNCLKKHRRPLPRQSSKSTGVDR